MIIDEFYVARAATSFESWVNEEGTWNFEDCGDPIKHGYNTDYPTFSQVYTEAKTLKGEVLIFSMEEPYKLIDRVPT
jgi:hypothetical protein